MHRMRDAIGGRQPQRIGECRECTACAKAAPQDEITQSFARYHHHQRVDRGERRDGCSWPVPGLLVETAGRPLQWRDRARPATRSIPPSPRRLHRSQGASRSCCCLVELGEFVRAGDTLQPMRKPPSVGNKPSRYLHAQFPHEASIGLCKIADELIEQRFLAVYA